MSARFLIDTNVISEIRHPNGNKAVKRRYTAIPPEQIRLSAVVVGELERGVCRLPEGARKQDLRTWLDKLKNGFTSQILPLDTDVAVAWGERTAQLELAGKIKGASDLQIAATALVHNLVIVTRNTKDFSGTGVRLWNIWKDEMV